MNCLRNNNNSSVFLFTCPCQMFPLLLWLKAASHISQAYWWQIATAILERSSLIKRGQQPRTPRKTSMTESADSKLFYAGAPSCQNVSNWAVWVMMWVSEMATDLFPVCDPDTAGLWQSGQGFEPAAGSTLTFPQLGSTGCLQGSKTGEQREACEYRLKHLVWICILKQNNVGDEGTKCFLRDWLMHLMQNYSTVIWLPFLSVPTVPSFTFTPTGKLSCIHAYFFLGLVSVLFIPWAAHQHRPCHHNCEARHGSQWGSFETYKGANVPQLFGPACQVFQSSSPV